MFDHHLPYNETRLKKKNHNVPKRSKKQTSKKKKGTKKSHVSQYQQCYTWQELCPAGLEEEEGVEDPDGGGQHPVQGNNPAPDRSFFSCPEQLNRWPCHWLTDSLTESHSTFSFDIQRATLETCDLLDICSEWWEDMTWPKKIEKDKYKDNDKDILRTPPKSNHRDLWPLRHLFRVVRRHDMIKKIDKY